MHLEAVVHAHAAAFLGRTPWEVAHDEVLLADAHATAWECYGHRCVIIAMDPLALELEAWGATLLASDSDVRFAIAAPLLAHSAALADLPPLDPARSPVLAGALAAARAVASRITTQPSIPIAGPLALLTGLLGQDATTTLLGGDEDTVRPRLAELLRKQRPWIAAIAAAGAQPIIVEVPYAPALVPPDRFARVVQPALTELVREICTVCDDPPAILMEGNTTAIASMLAQTGAGLLVCPHGAGPIAFLHALRNHPDVTVRLDVARGLWTDGHWPLVCRNIAEAAQLARFHPNLVLGTGTLPLESRSVLVVDACNFADSLDPWLEAD